MGEKRRNLSGYRAVWLVAMFDLPVDTKEARKEYQRFRKALLQEGFLMLQFSVYGRYCASEEKSAAFKRRIRKALPPHGEVRLLAVTDTQFGKMEVFHGKKLTSAEEPPAQLLLF
jgi:CRISPR-associated protein Cas2